MEELKRYPVLRQLLADLRTLTVAEAVAEARERRAGVRVEDGRHVTRVEWRGAFFWLTGPQREVVRLLLDAAVGSATPDVDEAYLVRRAMAPGVRRLSQLFAGHPAWGTLVVPGARPATFRIVESPDADDRPDDVRVEPEN